MDISVECIMKGATEAINDCMEDFFLHWEKNPISIESKERTWKSFNKYIREFPLIHLITEVRADIRILWCQCLFSEEQKSHFNAMRSNAYSQKLLEEHLKEVERLRNFYQENKEILEKIARYQELWQCMSNLETQTHNPERLFHNRGAQLLKEEQDRKISSQLPRLEKVILSYLARREAEGHPLLVHGERFCDVVQRQWQDHKENMTRTVKHTHAGCSAQKPASGPLLKRKRLQIAITPNKIPLKIRREQTLACRELPKGRRKLC